MDEEKKRITLATAARIKQLRRNKGLSQEELAFRAGINAVYYGQLERGLKCPTIDTVYKIAKGLEISLPDLLCLDVNTFASKQSISSLKQFINRIPPNKLNQVFKLLEDIAILLE